MQSLKGVANSTSGLLRPCSRRAFRPFAAASTATLTKPVKALKPLNITKNNLLDSQGGESTRNIDGVVYYISYDKTKDEILVVDKQAGVRFPVVVDDNNRIRIDTAGAVPHAVAGFSQDLYAPVLRADAIGAEICNGRVAMLGFLGLAGVELTSGTPALTQLSSPAGLTAAAVLTVAVLAASIAPGVAGKVPARKVFPDENDAFPDGPLPYTWNALAEKINNRVAMVGVAGLLINEAFRGGAAVFPHLF